MWRSTNSAKCVSLGLRVGASRAPGGQDAALVREEVTLEAFYDQCAAKEAAQNTERSVLLRFTYALRGATLARHLNQAQNGNLWHQEVRTEGQLRLALMVMRRYAPEIYKTCAFSLTKPTSEMQAQILWQGSRW